jgi:hypothetical protein
MAGLGVAMLAGLAGCSATPSQTSAKAGGTPTPPASSPVASPSASPASPAQLQAFLIRVSDLTEGWNSTPYKAGPGGATGDSAMARCLGGAAPAKGVAEVHSDTFTSEGSKVGSSATSYRSPEAVAATLATYRNPKLAPCFTRLLKTALAKANPPGTQIQATYRVTPGTADYPPNVAAIGTGFIKVGAKGSGTYLSTAYITGPLVAAEVNTFNDGEPVPENASISLFGLVADRVAKR